MKKRKTLFATFCKLLFNYYYLIIIIILLFLIIIIGVLKVHQVTRKYFIVMQDGASSYCCHA